MKNILDNINILDKKHFRFKNIYDIFGRYINIYISIYINIYKYN